MGGVFIIQKVIYGKTDSIIFQETLDQYKDEADLTDFILQETLDQCKDEADLTDFILQETLDQYKDEADLTDFDLINGVTSTPRNILQK